ncbi:MAG: hypothetical protein V3U78_04555 [Thiotrichaceae bacterium]
MTEYEEAKLRHQKKLDDGLLHVSYTVRDNLTATRESICKEINEMDRAVERGDYKTVTFNDATRVE